MKKAVGYIWVSDSGKKQEIEDQKQEILLFCKIHKLTLMQTFIDTGKENRDFKGEGWKLLENYLYRCHYLLCCVVTTNPDRLTRNSSLYIKKEAFIKDQYNITIAVAVTNRIDPGIVLLPYILN